MEIQFTISLRSSPYCQRASSYTLRPGLATPPDVHGCRPGPRLRELRRQWPAARPPRSCPSQLQPAQGHNRLFDHAVQVILAGIKVVWAEGIGKGRGKWEGWSAGCARGLWWQLHGCEQAGVAGRAGFTGCVVHACMCVARFTCEARPPRTAAQRPPPAHLRALALPHPA